MDALWQTEIELEYDSTGNYIEIHDIEDFADRSNVAVVHQSLDLYFKNVRISTVAIDGVEYGWLLTGIDEKLVISVCIGNKHFPIPIDVTFDEMWPEGRESDIVIFDNAVAVSGYLDEIFGPNDDDLSDFLFGL